MLLYVPTAPEMEPTATAVARGTQPRAAAVHGERELRELVAEGRGLGLDAVRAADADGVPVLDRARRLSTSTSRSALASTRSVARPSVAPSAVSSRSDDVIP